MIKKKQCTVTEFRIQLLVLNVDGTQSQSQLKVNMNYTMQYKEENGVNTDLYRACATDGTVIKV